MDGQSAIDYLEGRGRYADRVEFPLPALILLDLQLPRRDGFDVLESIARNPELEKTMTAILTSSGEERDVVRAFALGAQSYLVKPPRAESLRDLMRAVVAHRRTAEGGERMRIAGGRYPIVRAASR